MIVSLTITDKRTTPFSGSHQPDKTESYERVALTLTGDPAVIAATLRGIADDLAPVIEVPSSPPHQHTLSCDCPREVWA